MKKHIDKILKKITKKEPEDMTTQEKLKYYKKKLGQTQKELDKYKKNSQEMIINKIKSRRSIRKYSTKEINWDIIYKIIESSYTAPAAGDIKNHKIIVITEHNQRQELGKIALQQYWLAHAPYILVVTRDDSHLKSLYPELGGRYSIQNTAAAIQNMLLTAHTFDLGACWVEAFNSEAIKEFLSIPAKIQVDAIIPIGYPMENPKKEIPLLRERIFFKKFGNIFRKRIM